MDETIVIDNTGRIIINNVYAGKLARYDLGDPGIKKIVNSLKKELAKIGEEYITASKIQKLIAKANHEIFFYSTEQKTEQTKGSVKMILRKDGRLMDGDKLIGTISKSDSTDEEIQHRVTTARMRVTNAVMAGMTSANLVNMIASENKAIERILPEEEPKEETYMGMSIDHLNHLIEVVGEKVETIDILVVASEYSNHFLKIKDTLDPSFDKPVVVSNEDLVKYHIQGVSVVKVSGTDDENTLKVSVSEKMKLKSDVNTETAKKALEEIRQMVKDNTLRKEISIIDEMLGHLAECVKENIRENIKKTEAPSIDINQVRRDININQVRRDIRGEAGNKLDQCSAVWAYNQYTHKYEVIKDRQGDLPKTLHITDIIDIAITEQRSTLVVSNEDGYGFKTVLYYNGDKLSFY